DLEVEGARLFLSPALADSRPTGSDPAAWMGALLASLGPGDTFVINAFLEDAAVAPEAGRLEEAAAIEVPDTTRAVLQRIREAVGRHAKVATTLDFGPRYLHSTGQLQKGGPDRMAGLQLWQSAASREAGPLPIPAMGGDFAVLAEAQAAGDFAVLCERGRRMIGVDVGADPTNTLSRLLDWIEQALSRA
ncbi:MAG TPA: hypothetical protein VKA74_02490, partial [Myxococcota bacterium]|nr:hypothetical protein [Myxococcota bacterium]